MRTNSSSEKKLRCLQNRPPPHTPRSLCQAEPSLRGHRHLEHHYPYCVTSFFPGGQFNCSHSVLQRRLGYLGLSYLLSNCLPVTPEMAGRSDSSCLSWDCDPVPHGLCLQTEGRGVASLTSAQGAHRALSYSYPCSCQHRAAEWPTAMPPRAAAEGRWETPRAQAREADRSLGPRSHVLTGCWAGGVGSWGWPYRLIPTNTVLSLHAPGPNRVCLLKMKLGHLWPAEGPTWQQFFISWCGCKGTGQ